MAYADCDECGYRNKLRNCNNCDAALDGVTESQLEAAVAAEREACAMVAQEEGIVELDLSVHPLSAHIANRIRARGNGGAKT